MGAWYYLKGEEVEGPFSEDDFARLIKDGTVLGDTMVCNPEDGDEDPDWFSASGSEMARFFTQAAAPAAAPQGRRKLDLGESQRAAVSETSSAEIAEITPARRERKKNRDGGQAETGESFSVGAAVGEVIDVAASKPKGYVVSWACFGTGMLLIIMFFFRAEAVYHGEVKTFYYMMSLVAPFLNGVLLSFDGHSTFTGILTLTHFVLLVWVLILMFSKDETWRSPIVIINRAWAFCSLSVLAVAACILFFILAKDAAYTRERREEESAARILRKAMRK
jgi:hypothetical protein